MSPHHAFRRGQEILSFWPRHAASETITGFLILLKRCIVVSVAQLVEPRIVIPVVAGSIPVAHPKPEKHEKLCLSPGNRLILNT